MKKITLEDIIARKEEITQKKDETVKLFIKSLDGYIVAKKPDRALIMDAKQLDDEIDSNIHLAYNSIIEPDLKDKKAQEAFGVHTPKELFQCLLSDGEAGMLALQLIELAGYKKDLIREVTDELKN